MSAQTEADAYGTVYLVHYAFVKMSHFFPKPFFVQRSDLLQKNNAVFLKPEVVGEHVDVGRQLALVGSAGYCGGNDSGAVSVADVVLNYENGSYAALLGADHGT